MFWGGKTFVRPEGEWEDGRRVGEWKGERGKEERREKEERERKRGREGNLWRE